MIVICVTCSTETSATSVGRAICPCGSRCFKWYEDGVLGSALADDVRWAGTMATEAGRLVRVTRQGFKTFGRASQRVA